MKRDLREVIGNKQTLYNFFNTAYVKYFASSDRIDCLFSAF